MSEAEVWSEIWRELDEGPYLYSHHDFIWMTDLLTPEERLRVLRKEKHSYMCWLAGISEVLS